MLRKLLHLIEMVDVFSQAVRIGAEYKIFLIAADFENINVVEQILKLLTDMEPFTDRNDTSPTEPERAQMKVRQTTKMAMIRPLMVCIRRTSS